MSMSIEDSATPRAPKSAPPGPDNVFEQLSLKDRVCVVTGASGGIGSAVASAYAEAGAHVALWYNSNAGPAESLASSLSSTHGIRAKAFQVNVASADAVKKGVEDVVSEFGKLDVFVANAGTGNSKPLLEMSLDEVRELNAVNLDSVVYCAKFAGEVFKKQGKGNLIITSSISAHIVNVPVDQPIYNASKAYILHLGRSLAREWREFARVNIVSPGFFNTAMGASDRVKNEAHRMAVLGRQGETREIKGIYLYLASDASSYQTGSDTIIDGGYVLP
ncbi:NAD(P)-binding protein [Periconia macrospinosa]|uniref:NADP-dependent mannitol dehydrogenase n=1 Tax=Periconia macrospinosa TaxID=97972 RepID=A0A2V1E095_9PLEO|nr:NAD(P)-binding protein [Periconia macrospinosa]